MKEELIERGLQNLQQAEKKEKRGRHPKGCDCGRCVWSKPKGKALETKETTEPLKVESFEEVDALDEALREYNMQAEPVQDDSTGEEEYQEEQEQAHDNGMKISGVVLLGVIDLFFPVLMVKIWSFFSEKAKKIDPSKMKMTKDEKEELKELADMVAAEYVKMSPLQMFTISIGVIYYNKAQEQL